MLRNIVNFCLFTILLFSQLTNLNATTVRIDLDLDLRELSYIPEADDATWSKRSTLLDQWVSACNFSKRYEVATYELRKDLNTAKPALVGDLPPVPRVAAKREPIVALKRNPLTEIPLCLIRDSQTDSFISVSFERVSIPMVLIPDSGNELTAAEELEVFADDVEAFPKELEAEIPVSIELENDGVDPYWQYYDDCDRWGVDFAKLLSEGLSVADSTAAHSYGIAPVSYEQVSTVSPASLGVCLFALSPMLTKERSVVDLDWAKELVLETEFVVLETEGIDLDFVHVRALSPVTQGILIGEPIAGSYLSGAVRNSKSLFNGETLSCNVFQIQQALFNNLESVVASGRAHHANQKVLYRNSIANQIQHVADVLNLVADSIRR